jgi:hypothetical protein
MAGIEDRVKGFLESWSIIREHLDKLLEEPKEQEKKP